MIERILEPEVMDDESEAQEYDQMDFSDVNYDFALLASKLKINQVQTQVLDIGTGTARIPLFLSQLCPEYEIVGVDLAQSMLKLGQKNIEQANKSDRIRLELIDGKKMPYPDHSFDLVMTNSLVHHIPHPYLLFKQIDRVVKKDGNVLIRDLLRPDSVEQINQIVEQANLDYSPRQKKLFQDSLHAALTIAEVKAITQQIGWHKAQVYQSSPRHWTLEYRSDN